MNYLHAPTNHSWRDFYLQEAAKPYAQRLKAFLTHENALGRKILPSEWLALRPLDFVPLWGIKCVIIGQDPYPQERFANGMAFGVPYTTEKKDWPGSLKNINRALKSDLGTEIYNPDLTSWASDGCLLLNRVLTVQEGKSLSHVGKGWEEFTENLCRYVIDAGRPVVWVLWGKVAQDGIMPILEETRAFEKGHEVITSVHPSPQSAHAGFIWSKPFSKINAFCDKMGYSRISWEG